MERNVNRNRFRKVSLRLALFVLMPLSAIAFFVSSRAMHANRQTEIMQLLDDQSISNRWTNVTFSRNEIWWQAFWGGDPALNVEHASISGTPEQLQAIEPLLNLKSLSLDHPPGDLTAQRMRNVIARHPKLAAFDVQGSPSKEVWQEISRTPKLEELAVTHGNNFDDEVLGYFVDRPLTSLSLPEAPSLTDQSCQLIAKITTLKNLNLGATRISDRGVETLGTLQSLESLSLQKTRILGTGLAGFGDHSRLKHLDLARCQLDPRAFPRIAKFRWLQSLYLPGTSTGDQQLAQLTHLTELRDLSLNGTPVTDEVTKQLVKFPALQSLSLDYTQITDDAILRLAVLKKLRFLSVRNTYVSPMALNRLGDSVTHDRDDGALTIGWEGAAVVDTSNGEVVGYVPAFPKTLSNRYVVASSAEFDAATVFELQPGEPIRFLRDVYPLIGISADESQLITMNQGRVVAYQLPGGHRKRDIQLYTQAPSASMRIVGDQIFGIGTYVSCWQLETGKMLWNGAPQLPLNRNIIAHKNRLALFNTREVAVITALDDNVEFKLHQFPLSPSSFGLPHIRSVGFSDDGSVIIAQISAPNVLLEIRDLEADKTIASLPITPPTALLSANAKVIATAETKESPVQIWNATTGELMATVNVDGRYEELMFTPDGRYLIVAVTGNAIKPKYQ